MLGWEQGQVWSTRGESPVGDKVETVHWGTWRGHSHPDARPSCPLSAWQLGAVSHTQWVHRPWCVMIHSLLPGLQG